MTEVRSAMKDIRMHLTGNPLQAYARFVMYGKEGFLQLDGSLETHDGYIGSNRRLAELARFPFLPSRLTASCMSCSTRSRIEKSSSCLPASNQFALKTAAS